MERANYKKVLEKLGYDPIYNQPTGRMDVFTNSARIDIDNTSGRATEVLERVISYVDALLYEIQRYEPENATDVLTFILNDELLTLDVEYMTQDADDADWEAWRLLRNDILNAKQISIEYSFAFDADCAKDLVNTGIKRMLDDVLAGGRLADCVSFRIKVSNGFASEGDGLELCSRRYLWLNGMHKGRYICDEVPFEQNEQLIRSFGGWRQSGTGSEECDGIFLNLHPRTSPTLLSRLRKCVKDFTRKIPCAAEVVLSLDEYSRRYMEEMKEYITPGMIDKEIDDKEQRDFPDLRKYFSDEEVQSLLNRYPTLSRLYIKYADDSYSADDLERIRFLWTLALMGGLESEGRSAENSNGIRSYGVPPTDDYMKVFYQLPEEIRIRLYGTADYEKTHASHGEDVRPTTYNLMKKFINTHTGLGDLSVMEEAVKGYIWGFGYSVHLNMIYLSGIEDVRTMCTFLNELKEIERLAQEETGRPCPEKRGVIYQRIAAAPWLNCGSEVFIGEEGKILTGPDFEELECVPKQTIRDFYARIETGALDNMNALLINDGQDIQDEDLTFETDNADNCARLRFRLENGRYIYEIAQVDD